MRTAEVRFLFDYDRWATERVLDAWDRLGPTAETKLVGDRGLNGIMLHMLGSAERWRAAFAGEPIPGFRERAGDVPGPDPLRAAWKVEWDHRRHLFDGLDDAAIEAPYRDPNPAPGRIDGAPLWQLMLHVVNHGTQHRSEAAALLTEAGVSPGDMDLGEFVLERQTSRLR